MRVLFDFDHLVFLLISFAVPSITKKRFKFRSKLALYLIVSKKTLSWICYLLVGCAILMG